MTEELGRQLARFQAELAHTWKTQGPETVKQYLEHLDQTELITLLMLNIGAQARSL